MPYCYVVFRYSILYYYETGALPPNYSDWIKIAERISKDARFRNRFEYYLRVNADMSLSNAIALKKRIFLNYRSTVADMGVYCKYALTHTKEEYESVESQLREMILQKKYVLRDGHMISLLQTAGAKEIPHNARSPLECVSKMPEAQLRRLWLHFCVDFP